MAKWTKIYHQKFEAYKDAEGNIVYQANENGKHEVVKFPEHGLREVVYKGNSEKVANAWMEKVLNED